MPAYGKVKVDTITYDLSGTATDVSVSNIATKASPTFTGTVTAPELDLTGNTSLKLPVGTTAQRPTGATGDIRFNSTLSKVETYTGDDKTAIDTNTAVFQRNERNQLVALFLVVNCNNFLDHFIWCSCYFIFSL